MAVILISHDLGVIAEMAQQVVVMYAGKVMEEGGVRDLFKHPAHPYTRSLLKSIPYLQKKGRKQELYEIPGVIPSLLALPPGYKFRPRCSVKQDRCALEEPPLSTVSDGHLVRCWSPYPF